MDFLKFMQLLEEKALWFARADQFDDPLEGTFTDAELTSLRSSPNFNTPPQGQELPIIDATKGARLSAFINCWRSGDSESMAMWDLYGKGSGTIAIKTTAALLKEQCILFEREINIYNVEYIDWDTEHWDWNLISLFARKDKSYQHESEVRAIIFDMNAFVTQNKSVEQMRSWEAVTTQFAASSLQGIRVPIEPSKIITEVVIGPRGQAWVEPLVSKILERYQLAIPIRSSNRLNPR